MQLIGTICHKEESANFISFYVGAYGSKGTISFSEPGGKIRYQRGELNRDVSMAAFVPIPPDVMNGVTEQDEAIDVLLLDQIPKLPKFHNCIPKSCN